jgi:hypothetical protein
MTTTPSDRRRYGVIEIKFHPQGNVAIYILSINGQTWAQVEWSPARRAWCIQDASGRCLAHCDAIHGQDVDAQTAVDIARRMIVDGRIPTPEEAERQLAQRLATERQLLPPPESVATMNDLEVARTEADWDRDAAGRGYDDEHRDYENRRLMRDALDGSRHR